jgi:hypothetical protein
MTLWRKKPVVVEAVQLPYEGVEMAESTKDKLHHILRDADWESGYDETLLIHTLEGVMEAKPGDWIIRGVKGECYPCKPDIFAMTYEAVNDYDSLVIWYAYCDRKMELEDAQDRIEVLEAALRKLLELVESCKMVEKGAGGMTIDAQMRRSVYLSVPAYLFEEAREVLEKTSHDQ